MFLTRCRKDTQSATVTKSQHPTAVQSKTSSDNDQGILDLSCWIIFL